jgi:hypothetical protein
MNLGPLSVLTSILASDGCKGADPVPNTVPSPLPRAKPEEPVNNPPFSSEPKEGLYCRRDFGFTSDLSAAKSKQTDSSCPEWAEICM